ncbi:MAG: hypothetical protein KBT57_10675, partial [bacterium]|nr:hypothetical protein [Candidatus Limimorpha equi]
KARKLPIRTPEKESSTVRGRAALIHDLTEAMILILFELLKRLTGFSFAEEMLAFNEVKSLKNRYL